MSYLKTIFHDLIQKLPEDLTSVHYAEIISALERAHVKGQLDAIRKNKDIISETFSSLQKSYKNEAVKID